MLRLTNQRDEHPACGQFPQAQARFILGVAGLSPGCWGQTETLPTLCKLVCVRAFAYPTRADPNRPNFVLVFWSDARPVDRCRILGWPTQAGRSCPRPVHPRSSDDGPVGIPGASKTGLEVGEEELGWLEGGRAMIPVPVLLKWERGTCSNAPGIAPLGLVLLSTRAPMAFLAAPGILR